MCRMLFLFFFLSDPEPVNFMHLMSMGYQRDWLNEHAQKTEEEREEQRVCIFFFKFILLCFSNRVEELQNPNKEQLDRSCTYWHQQP